MTLVVIENTFLYNSYKSLFDIELKNKLFYMENNCIIGRIDYFLMSFTMYSNRCIKYTCYVI